MSLMNNPEENLEINRLSKEIKRLSRKVNFKKSDTSALHDRIEAIEFEGLRRVTGLDQFMTIEILNDGATLSKISINTVVIHGPSFDKMSEIRVYGYLLRMDGTVGVKYESSFIHKHSKLKRRHIDGSWVDLPEPKGYLK